MAEIEFELFNNQLLQQMVGPNDSNLKVIEETLNVEIGTFGNHISIKGSDESCKMAKEAIDSLYSKVSRGIEIGEQEVKAAIRLSGADIGNNKQIDLNDIVLKTKKDIFTLVLKPKLNIFWK